MVLLSEVRTIFLENIIFTILMFYEQSLENRYFVELKAEVNKWFREHVENQKLPLLNVTKIKHYNFGSKSYVECILIYYCLKIKKKEKNVIA